MCNHAGICMSWTADGSCCFHRSAGASFALLEAEGSGVVVGLLAFPFGCFFGFSSTFDVFSTSPFDVFSAFSVSFLFSAGFALDFEAVALALAFAALRFFGFVSVSSSSFSSSLPSGADLFGLAALIAWAALCVSQHSNNYLVCLALKILD